MKTIPLTQGYVALVDDEDFERLSKFKWNVAVTKCTYRVKIYAKRKEKVLGKYTTIRMHRFILGCSGHVDHKDGDGLNNQRGNLRPATRMQNGANRKKSTAECSSRWKGVCWRKDLQKWNAYIYFNKQRRHLGHFADEFDAAQAYNFAALELFGEFAKLNEPLREAA